MNLRYILGRIMLLLTRFDNSTLGQNIRWKENNGWKGCAYGVRVRCPDNWEGSIVIEMNNSTNKIVGLGEIIGVQEVRKKKAWKIYDDDKYNRFVYYGKRHVDIDKLTNIEQEVVEILEIALFSGKSHSKRGNSWGVPQWILQNEYIDFDSELTSIMNKRTSL